jgi:hypothetical protein
MIGGEVRVAQIEEFEFAPGELSRGHEVQVDKIEFLNTADKTISTKSLVVRKDAMWRDGNILGENHAEFRILHTAYFNM